MFGNLLKKKQAPKIVAPAKDAATILSKLRATTDVPDLAKLIDIKCGQILREHIPMLVEVKNKGVRQKLRKDRLSFVGIHDLAFEHLAQLSRRLHKPITANVREGGRAVAEIMDGVMRRQLILGDDENSVNRMAYMRVLHAQAELMEAADKLIYLPALTKEQRDADSTPTT